MFFFELMVFPYSLKILDDVEGQDMASEGLLVDLRLAKVKLDLHQRLFTRSFGDLTG